MIVIYNIFFYVGVLLGLPVILLTVLFAKKWRASFRYRLGFYSLSHVRKRFSDYPDTCRPIWIHALSVGEVISAAPLVFKLSESKENPIVFSATTKTGYDIAKSLFDDHVKFIFFFPFDLLFSVRRIASAIDAAIVIIVETDIWPSFLFEMKRCGIPVVLANARLSNRSYSRYRLLSFLTNRIFEDFSKICTQTATDADRFRYMGVSSHIVTVTGNIKFDQTVEQLTDTDLKHLKRQMRILDNQKVIVAGSTHDGEESILLSAFNRLKERHPDLMMIVVPRHPDRALSILTEFRPVGWVSVLMKDLPAIEPITKIDIIVVDGIGLLKKLYALADVAFVGGSLVKAGGHNPLEPAAFGKPVLFGPDMSDFKQISSMLMDNGGGLCVHDAESIYQAADLFLKDEEKALNAGKNAFHLLNTNRGAIDKTVAAVDGVINNT